MKRDLLSAAGREVLRRLDVLARVTDEPGQITRTFLSPAMGRANAQVGEWMRADGLSVREDAVGNLIGRQDGPGRTLVLGSHLDTVRNAGRFDGPLGVILPSVALAVLRAEGITWPFAVEVLGFAEEEGVRFASAYLGSKGYAGLLRARDLRFRDQSGVSVGDALMVRDARFALPKPAHGRAGWLGYVETHIEQGPVLEQRRLPVGFVTGIAAQVRGRAHFAGKAGHAGTTPMALRRDALAGAAEWMTWVERFAAARGRVPLVATVGTIGVRPGAANVIPAEAMLTLDIRHPGDHALGQALKMILTQGKAIARRRGLRFSWQLTQNNGAVSCDPALTAALKASVRAVGIKPLGLTSGAGHDGVVMSARTGIAMLFVRCRDGLSHHPDEYASAADITIALRVMCDFIRRLAGH
jgi:allantoate deiminase